MLAPNSNPKIVAQTLGTNEHRDLQQTGIFPRYAPSGHLVYFQGSNLIAVPFDPQRLTTTGAAVPVVQGVLPVGFSFSSTGTLIYISDTLGAGGLKLVWVDRKGAEQPVPAPATIMCYRGFLRMGSA